MTLYAWNVDDELYGGEVEVPNCLGTVVNNPNHDQVCQADIE